MVTLTDIARAAGVSTMTVSNALRGRANVSEATRARTVATAEALDYRTNMAARALSSGRSNIIEFIVQDLDYPFYGKLANAVSRAADRRGMQTLVRQSLYSAESEKSAVDVTNSVFCDGLILATPQISADEARRLAKHKPIVLIDDCSAAPQLSTVNTPNREGSRQAVAHLLASGVRRLLMLGADGNMAQSAPMPSPTSPMALASLPETVGGLRTLGAMEAVREAGLGDVQVMFHPIDWTYDQARRAMIELFDAGTTFDGVFAMSDVVALGAIRGLADVGLSVPGNVKVAGFDGTTFGEVSVPSLTTVDIDMEAMADIIVSRLMAQIETSHTGAGSGNSLNVSASTTDVAPFRLTIRESTR